MEELPKFLNYLNKFSSLAIFFLAKPTCGNVILITNMHDIRDLLRQNACPATAVTNHSAVDMTLLDAGQSSTRYSTRRVVLRNGSGRCIVLNPLVDSALHHNYRRRWLSRRNHLGQEGPFPACPQAGA
jgi:hypothetical protein